MPEKLMRCVADVKAKNAAGGKQVNPYAVCQASTGLHFEHHPKTKAMLAKRKKSS